MRFSVAVLIFAGMAMGIMPRAEAQYATTSGRGASRGSATIQPGAGRGTSRQQQPQQEQDPGEFYLNAYNLCQESEELARQGNYAQAIKKGQRAEKILAGIVRDFPDWKPSMVAARRRILAENLEQYRQAAAQAPIPSGRQPGNVVPKDEHIPIPGIDDKPAQAGAKRPVKPKKGQNQGGSGGGGSAITGSDYEPIELPDYETTDRYLYNALARAQEECRRMAAAYSDLNSRYVETQKQLNDARIEQQMYRERYENLQQQIEEERAAGNQVVEALSQQLEEMEAKYQESERARIAAEARVAELEERLEATEKELERVTRERDALRAENEQLRAIVDLNSPEKTRALLDQNLTLADQLQQAEERVATLEGLLAASDDQNVVLQQQLAQAREEVLDLRDQMSAVYDENLGYRRRISELTERLNALEAKLEADAARPVVDPALAEENRILREVVRKQRRSLQMQEEGRRLLVDAYIESKNQDPGVLNAIQRMDDQSNLDLTEAEQRIITTVTGGDDVQPGPETPSPGEKAVRRSLEIETLANLAAEAFAKGRYTAAEQLYRTLYEVQPDHVAGLVNLGTILLYRNKCEEAAEFFERAIRLAPDLAICYYLAGTTYYRMDRMDKAERMFARTVELDPANAEAFFYLANIEATTDRGDIALKHFAAAVKLKPALGDAHYNMARLYAEKGLIPDAARAYDRAVHAGSEPDPEFEAYLRNHPDVSKAPGPDLVELSRPQEEADALLADDPEIARMVERNRSDGLDSNVVDTTTNDTPATPAEQGADSASETPEPTAPGLRPATPEEQEAFMREREAISSRTINDAPSPSAAGKGHKTDKSRFDDVRVRVSPNSNRRVWLRAKKPEPQRLRQRGGSGEIQTVKKDGKGKK